MADDISLERVEQAVGQVMHPAINHSLVELGMVKNLALDCNQVTLTLALPFPNIPFAVKDYLISSLRAAVAELGVEVNVEITDMTEEERQNFLTMEQTGWKGLA
jgi:metal-sulfur cluster biosynthetic enzyme